MGPHRRCQPPRQMAACRETQRPSPGRPSDKLLCICFCLEPHTALPMRPPRPQEGPVCEGVHLPLQEIGEPVFGLGAGPVDSFARAARLCLVRRVLAYHPGLTSEWLRLAREPPAPRLLRATAAARGRAGSAADAQREPLFSGTWGLCANRAVRSHGVLGVTGRGSEDPMCSPGRPGHEFRNGKADDSGPGGCLAAIFCDNVHGAWGASPVVVPAPTRRGQATSSIPTNKELQPPLAAGLCRPWPGSRLSAGAPFGEPVPNGLHSEGDPCSLGPFSLVSASPDSPGTEREEPSEGGDCAEPLGDRRVGLRGRRKAWLPAKGTASVSRSDGPTGAAAGPSSAGGLRAGGRCRQEASKCLRIWT